MPPAEPASQYPIVGGARAAGDAGDAPPGSGDAVGGSVFVEERSGPPEVADALSLGGGTAPAAPAQDGTADVGAAGHRVLVGTGVAAAAGTAAAAEPTSTAPAETAARRTHRRWCRLRIPLAITSPSSCVSSGACPQRGSRSGASTCDRRTSVTPPVMAVSARLSGRRLGSPGGRSALVSSRVAETLTTSRTTVVTPPSRSG